MKIVIELIFFLGVVYATYLLFTTGTILITGGTE